MEIRLAKTAGFCFGVNRAVELTYGLLAEGHKVATLGPLIHNPQAVEDMRRKGAQVVDTVQDVPAGCEVVIRSHGVPRSVYDELATRGIPYHDATCPFVQKIQRIAAQAEKEGAVLLVAGDKTHPEVQGSAGCGPLPPLPANKACGGMMMGAFGMSRSSSVTGSIWGCASVTCPAKIWMPSMRTVR